MKKVLFATTALVATAGVAAAEVTFGGYGRFGVIYQSGLDGFDSETRIEQRFRLTVTGVTETDNGLKFEGRIRFQTDDNAAGSASTANSSAAGFAVSTGGLRLDVGHVSDVIDSGDVVDYYGYGIGLTSFGEQSSAWALPASGFGSGEEFDTVAPTVKIRYNYDAFTVSASYTDNAWSEDWSLGQDNFDPLAAPPVGDGGWGLQPRLKNNEEWQVGASYSFGNYSIGGVYGSQDIEVADFDAVTGEFAEGGKDNNDFWVVGFSGEFGAFSFSAIVGDSDIQNDTSYGISGQYEIGAATNIRAVFSDNGIDGSDEVYGVGFQHSLGGGVSLRGGVGNNAAGKTTADLGVVFNF